MYANYASTFTSDSVIGIEHQWTCGLTLGSFTVEKNEARCLVFQVKNGKSSWTDYRFDPDTQNPEMWYYDSNDGQLGWKMQTMILTGASHLVLAAISLVSASTLMAF